MTAEDIRHAMRVTWRQPEWALMFEVSDGTGAARNRTVDAVLMSLWPSRGLELHGVEIKISRSDWLRELRDAEKARAISRHCDAFWLHAPQGIARIDELPPGWGLREWTGDAWDTKVDATVTPGGPVQREFLAAILRRASKDRDRDVAAGAERMVRDRMDAMDQEMTAKLETLAADALRTVRLFDLLSEETGLTRDQIATDHDLRSAVRLTSALLRSGLAGGYSALPMIRETIAATLERLDLGMTALGMEQIGVRKGDGARRPKG